MNAATIAEEARHEDAEIAAAAVVQREATDESGVTAPIRTIAAPALVRGEAAANRRTTMTAEEVVVVVAAAAVALVEAAVEAAVAVRVGVEAEAPTGDRKEKEGWDRIALEVEAG